MASRMAARPAPAVRIIPARMSGSSMPCTGMPSVVVSRPVTRRTPWTNAARWWGPARRIRVPSISNKTRARWTWVTRSLPDPSRLKSTARASWCTLDDSKRRYNGLVKQAKFRVGLIQMACSLDPNENLAKAEWRIREAAAKGAQIICLQELFRSQYFCQTEDLATFDLAEPIPGPTTESFTKLAAELNVVIVASVFERRMAGVYHNTAVVIDAGGALLGLYRKMHIPDDPRFYEKYYFTPGDLGFRCFDTRYARIAPLICWDQWYPEAARLAALGGAQILLYPTAIGFHHSDAAEAATQHNAWETIQRSHAIANGVYVAAVNRVGHEGPAGEGLEFWGGSFVSDPQGRMLAKAGDTEETLMVECDPRVIESVRRNWPFLRDRRTDAYGPIVNRVID